MIRDELIELWQPLAALLIVGVLFFGGVIAVSNCLRPLPQTITVYLINKRG